jgi:hypothetical protein
VSFDSLRREQAQWLAQTVQRPELRDAPFRVVFCHIPLRWLNETPPDYDNRGFDFCSLRSRDAWHKALVEWKAQLVISGHTHHTAWIPPGENFPYGQLTGGGPQPGSATWISGKATAKELNLKVRDLTGKILHDVTFGAGV